MYLDNPTLVFCLLYMVLAILLFSCIGRKYWCLPRQTKIGLLSIFTKLTPSICVACSKSIEECELIYTTRCGHQFHEECLSLKDTKCPTCKEPIFIV